MTIKLSPKDVIDDILEHLPKELVDKKTGSPLTDYREEIRVHLNSFCTIQVSSISDTKVKVKLTLDEAPDGGNRQTSYASDENGNISPSLVKRALEHTLLRKEVEEENRKQSNQLASDAKKLELVVNELTKTYPALTVDAYRFRCLRNGIRRFICIESKRNGFKLHLSIDCNEDLMLDELHITQRSIDMPVIKRLISIFGLETYIPLVIPKPPAKEADELFNTSMFN